MSPAFSTPIRWEACSPQQRAAMLARPAVAVSDRIGDAVRDIIAQVRQGGDAALNAFNQRFDHIVTDQLRVSPEAIKQAADRLAPEVKQAMATAVNNIESFHRAQQLPPVDVETQPGVRCRQLTRPVASVGLYIPGGSAPLPSTALMLATPARIAGCKRVILCSPPPSPMKFFTRPRCAACRTSIRWGAQAIAAMAFGSESIPKVDKIFGPGNAWVTEAKRQVSQLSGGAAIDMPAGPSEVLVIADSDATPAFVAADLLSQAEHGPDSQVILLTPDPAIAEAVAEEIEAQIARLSRGDIARQALEGSRLIIARDLAQCIDISNAYGPEHLIIQTRDAQERVAEITNAGSVFLGDWSPESAGDYASGTNHVLPTYGYTSTYSSLGLADFQKRMTVQHLTPQGLLALAPTIETLATAERLTAHKYAVTVRVAALNALQEQP
ncbi:histidinol dehydrogenase [Acerihabitans sp. KWT182]|uniref:Histidinol dehydrogenase n=1 Tax=Acerihabitans sp. KWT182 TaxID=3157919 RepID=A0AAU7Q6E1_9GAMM